VTHGYSDDSNWFDSFSVEAIERHRRFFELFSVIAHLFEGYEEENFGLPTIVNKDFDNVPSVDMDGDNYGAGVRERG
jgi:hypothetical protein